MYKLHEDEKKRKYVKRVNEIEHRIFTPIVLTTTGGINKDCKIYHSRVAELIANKKEEQYHTTIAWKRAKIKFASPYSAADHHLHVHLAQEL